MRNTRQEYTDAVAALNAAPDERARQRAAIRYVAALLRASVPWALAYDEKTGPTHVDRVSAALDKLHLPCPVHGFDGCGMGC